MAGKVVNVAVIGCGLVGSSFLKQLQSVNSSITFNLILVAASKKSLISDDFKPLQLAGNWKETLSASGKVF